MLFCQSQVNRIIPTYKLNKFFYAFFYKFDKDFKLLKDYSKILKDFKISDFDIDEEGKIYAVSEGNFEILLISETKIFLFLVLTNAENIATA